MSIGTQFKFKMSRGLRAAEKGGRVYTARKQANGLWHVTWDGCNIGAHYRDENVIYNLKNDLWAMVAVVKPDVLSRINALQLKGVSVLFDKDMTVNIRGMQGVTQLGLLGLCRTQEELEQALTRAEKEFGITT